MVVVVVGGGRCAEREGKLWNLETLFAPESGFSEWAPQETSTRVVRGAGWKSSIAGLARRPLNESLLRAWKCAFS